MGFTKDSYEPDIAIVAKHPMLPGAEFTFYFPKRLPQSTLDAEKVFLGLKDSETADAFRLALINVVAEMVTRPPAGFDDFPSGNVAGSVADHVRAYFDEPDKPEFEAIILGVWRAYKRLAIPDVYLKSAESDGQRGPGVPPAT